MPLRRTDKLRGVLAGRKKTRSSKSTSKTARKKKTTSKKAAAAAYRVTQADFPDGVAVGFQASDVKPDTSSDTTALQAKVEYSPNALAKCTACRKKIRKEQKRFGIPENSERYNKEIYRYYHYKCCPSDLKAQVPSASEDLKRQKEEASLRQSVIAARQGLADHLRTLRTTFANRLNVAAFLVFSNTTLDEMVYQMPTTSNALLQVRGIGPVKLQSFGDPILRLIKQYQNQQQHQNSQELMDRKPRAKLRRLRVGRLKLSSGRTYSEVITIEDSEDEEITGCETLTCEELVNRKFAHAAKNGYLISID